jgi:UDP-N-acetylglucosamine 2-epimerase (non-hydrolysing)
MDRIKIFSIVGTRPEAIKMAPVIRALGRDPYRFEHRVVTTAQHRQMLDQILSVFGIEPDIDLGLMQHDQSLAGFASRALIALSDLFAREKPDCVLIQGDTTTVMTAALAAFYNGIIVGHVEAGLRSFDRQNPFPEEINRHIAGCLADIHFAPTRLAVQNLLREGIREEDIFITGNTIVDALLSIPLEGAFDDPRLSGIDFEGQRVVLLTAHRRENHRGGLRSICRAMKELVSNFSDVEVVYPVHLNPNVRGPVYDELDGVPGIILVDPVSYSDLLKLMKSCYMILTDSGGIQEEAPSFHKPVLVLRELTERPEILEAGSGKVIGTDSARIVEEASLLLSNRLEYQRMSEVQNPFGDGHAAERIVEIIARRFLAQPQEQKVMRMGF